MVLLVGTRHRFWRTRYAIQALLLSNISRVHHFWQLLWFEAKLCRFCTVDDQKQTLNGVSVPSYGPWLSKKLKDANGQLGFLNNDNYMYLALVSNRQPLPYRAFIICKAVLVSRKIDSWIYRKHIGDSKLGEPRGVLPRSRSYLAAQALCGVGSADARHTILKPMTSLRT